MKIVTVEDNTIAIIGLEREENEALGARYRDIADEFPAPRWQIALALRELADVIDAENEELGGVAA